MLLKKIISNFKLLEDIIEITLCCVSKTKPGKNSENFLIACYKKNKIVKFSTLTDEAIFSCMLLKKIILNFKLLEDIIEIALCCVTKKKLSKNSENCEVSHID